MDNLWTTPDTDSRARPRLPWHDIGPEYAQDPYWIGVTGQDGDTFRVEEWAPPSARDTKKKTGWAKRFGTRAFLEEVGGFGEAAALFRESGANFSRIAELAAEVTEELDDAGRREILSSAR